MSQTEQHYTKIFINGDPERLPKETGFYFCFHGHALPGVGHGWREFKLNDPQSLSIWKHSIAWYLLPLPEIKSEQSKELKEAIDEREALIKAFDEIRKSFQGRKWIMEGRGAYPYDDERYKEEVRYIMDEFEEINKNLWRQIKSKSFEYKERLKKEIIAGLQQEIKAVVVPTETDVEKFINNEKQYYGSEAIACTEYAIKWFRSQLREVDLKTKLVKFCEKTHGYQLTPYEKIVDDFLSGKEQK